MNITGIICEYNPFHYGHKYQIDQIRTQCETAIVCIMSGNYVQRAESAVCDKYTRARMAIECGADLVLELPLPYSSATAERFAAGGVSILHRLFGKCGLAFSSECGNAELLTQTAVNLSSPDFGQALAESLSASPRGYPQARQEVYRSLYGGGEILSNPNDILGIEYLLAIRKLSAEITPTVIRRTGSGFNDPLAPAGGVYASATAVRRLLREGGMAAVEPFVPPEVFALLGRQQQDGGISSLERIDTAILLKLRQMSRDELLTVPDVNSELAHRLKSAAMQALTLNELYAYTAQKNYTSSRIRRVVLSAFLGIRKADTAVLPSYTTLLAANNRGCELLGGIRKTAQIPVITKPSAAKLSGETMAGHELNIRADMIYGLTLETRRDAGYYMRRTPYIKTD